MSSSQRSGFWSVQREIIGRGVGLVRDVSGGEGMLVFYGAVRGEKNQKELFCQTSYSIAWTEKWEKGRTKENIEKLLVKNQKDLSVEEERL